MIIDWAWSGHMETSGQKDLTAYGPHVLTSSKIFSHWPVSLLLAPTLQQLIHQLKRQWIVNVKLCEKVIFIASPRHFSFFICETETSKCFKWAQDIQILRRVDINRNFETFLALQKIKTQLQDPWNLTGILQDPWFLKDHLLLLT